MKTIHYPLFAVFTFLLILTSCSNTEKNVDFTLDSGIYHSTRAELSDKIKGGWAGQLIGCTYGGPTEFKYNGTMIGENTPILWNEDLMLWWYENAPGLYDDIYMDLTFVDVFEKEGLDADASSHALAFANAEYMLWHANQSARYNILHGIMPPESGHWTQNPHSEDIDFQIEADFAGLMSPGMVNSAAEICDKIGHIMNYGDGWYGGVYVAAMYSLAFVSNDIQWIVEEGLKLIPEESQFHQCISDVINWHRQYPGDWKQTWFECQKKWSHDIGCPDGVFNAFNIDAKINAAYIVTGLLYGNGDFGKTVDISTRCGQDSDCNPASAAGILGTMIGFEQIPEYWIQGLDKVEDLDFKYTQISLNDVCEMSTGQAMEMINRNGGNSDEDSIEILYQNPLTVAFEAGFPNHYPIEKIEFHNTILNKGKTEFAFDFKGKGFVVRGNTHIWDNLHKDLQFEVDVYIDGELHETAILPLSYQARRNEITWKYELPDTTHNVKLILKNPMKDYGLWLENCLVYGAEKINQAL